MIIVNNLYFDFQSKLFELFFIYEKVIQFTINQFYNFNYLNQIIKFVQSLFLLLE